MAGLTRRFLGPTAGRRRRKKRLILTLCAVFVVILAVTTAALVLPSVSDGAETAIAPPPDTVLPNPKITAFPESAPSPSSAGLAGALAGVVDDSDLGTFTGTVADARTGQVLWSRNPDAPMTPASTTKVLTAAAAMLALPADHRVTTRVVQGNGEGNIVLIAGGDPTLTALPVGTVGFYPGAARIDDLVEQIRRSGTTVSSISVDTSIYSGDTMAQGWFPADIAAGSITPIEPIMLDGGRSDPLVDESPRSTTPALDAGRALAAGLGVDPAAVTTGTAAEGADQLASVQSAPLRNRLQQMIYRSDNVLAEAVGRELSIETNTAASFSGAVASIGQTLYSAGFDMSGLALQDASGLSVDGKIPARLLDQVLTSAAGTQQPTLRPMLDYLPVAGATGTLSDRYASGDRTGAGWVRAKTGTLSNASALAGYVVDVDGRVLTFALMSNDRPPEVSRPALDAVASTLRLCGCQ
ncbi:D-alanyl-D-alanine carboxypeptidase/D-alanyl-D-alanine-endopeptidase [Rhodococcus sp. IEGM 1381]|uniref:D-alanyl-D-alanine carboxypeptidase/D-alanyl-D-alanine endopeptidase n=1 Tax=Rhodococcus sp. IEGM 1381 TaxID=3047085 RepID=UPI0024B6E9A6|nr:D-alanyl-D-alanine carboxypeptidase/D-alanyl-D-alanine-endopeptidase [Rhodococcus sp. IEGM 1381]MDI9896239.1 D-alanyl-D-alanine carboxypeptidase/D-alanyl-D-alanine-endopeptidase [Rhodococcus sp. IEGM 1381]